MTKDIEKIRVEDKIKAERGKKNRMRGVMKRRGKREERREK